MKFFTKYSLLTNLLSIITIIIFISYINYNISSNSKRQKKFSKEHTIELKAFDVNHNRYDKNGNLVMSFITKELYRYLNQDLYAIDIIQKNYDKTTGKLESQIEGKYAYYSINDSLIHIYNKVNAIIFLKKTDYYNNSTKSILLDKIFIKTSEIFYNNKSKEIYNNKFTKIYDPKTGNNTTGISIKGNFKTKIIKLNRSVRSYYAIN